MLQSENGLPRHRPVPGSRGKSMADLINAGKASWWTALPALELLLER